MCYDIKASLKAQLKRAQQNGDDQAVREIMEKLVPHTDLPLHHASGFTHPRLLIYPAHSPCTPLIATWGLVPTWVKDEAQKNELWNNTLNARGETLFEKPAFRDAAIHQRCLVYLDGFYEHHHLNKQAYPFYVQRSDQAPFAVAGLWSTWQHPLTGIPLTTFTLVTRPANTLMAKIHNNSGEKGPRMPLILEQDEEAQWLQPLVTENDRNQLEGLIQGEAMEKLIAHPVRALRGKAYRGNIPEISEEEVYPELGFFEF
jgi:putative SOS response-associated peptidase YedK